MIYNFLANYLNGIGLSILDYTWTASGCALQLTLPGRLGRTWDGAVLCGFSESGCDANIPIWDGRADSLSEFQQDGGMVASLHQLGEDEGVQPRFAMKQRDAAKIRALEFPPEELA